MGAWGLGLFQSDDDLDILDELTDALGCELYVPDNATSSRQHLDSGSLARYVQRKLPEANDPANHGDFPSESADYKMVILGAAAMQLGATLPEELREFMRENYTRVGLQTDGLEQIERGLREYTDGTPYDFQSLGLHDTMMASVSSGSLPRATPGGVHMINVAGPGRAGNAFHQTTQRAAESMRPDMSGRCSNCGRVAGAEQTFRACTGCRAVRYCNRGCQRAHSRLHKSVCAGAAGRA